MNNSLFGNMIDTLKAAFVSRRVRRIAAKKYRYFIAWNGIADGKIQIGNTDIILDYKIDSLDMIRKIEKALKGDEFTDMVIVNWRRFV